MRSTLNDDRKKAVAEQLQPTLVDLIDLALATKQAHWNETGLADFPEGWVKDEDAVKELADRIQQMAERTRERVDTLDKVDLASQDVLLEILQGLEEQLWMLAAQEES